QDLATAMKSRATIEQAKGILMGAQRCSADEAFQILVRASQRENRKLREVAEDLVNRVQQPAPPKPPA
ncbi:MAG TPA: ANTAR domain-containing protein, partial [Acidimicrobiales bacterium]|nr:ANTAR domain-containing protein [Acidimicrobiales bacterium]